MIKYLLQIDEKLWREFKSVCALAGIKIKDAIILAIERFISAEKGKE